MSHFLQGRKVNALVLVLSDSHFAGGLLNELSMIITDIESTERQLESNITILSRLKGSQQSLEAELVEVHQSATVLAEALKNQIAQQMTDAEIILE